MKDGSFSLAPFWKQSVGDSFHYLLSFALLKVVNVAVIPLLTRSLTIEDFAAYDLILTLNGLTVLVVALGMDSGVAIMIAEEKKTSDRLSFLLIFSITTSTSLTVLLWVAAEFSQLLRDPSWLSHQLVQLLFAYCLPVAVSYHCINFSRWVGMVKTAAYANVSTSIAGAGLGLTFLWCMPNAGITEYLWGLILGAWLGMTLNLFLLKKFLVRFSLPDKWRLVSLDLLKLSLPYVPNSLGNKLLSMSDRLVILSIMGPKELAVYALVSRIGAIPFSIFSVIGSALTPIFFRNRETQEGKAFIKQVYDIYQLAFVPASLFFFVLISEFLVELFGGEQFMGSESYLPLIIFFGLMNSGVQISGLGFAIKRKTHFIMYITFTTLAINFALSLIGGWLFGILGVIIGTVTASYFRLIVHTRASEKLYPIGYSSLVHPFLFFLLLWSVYLGVD